MPGASFALSGKRHRRLKLPPRILRLHICMLLVVVIQMFNANKEVNALRMKNLDVPSTARQGETISLGCFFDLHTATREQTRVKSSGNQRGALESSSEEHAIKGHETSELLYALKWYKDEREFFRYLTADWPKKQAFPMDGLSVDVDKSDNHRVVLKNVTLKTSGWFRCEVSTDAPHFVTKSISRKMIVFSPPMDGPRLEVVDISGRHSRNREFALGDRVELLCTSSDSKPHSSFDWILNNRMNLSDSVYSSVFHIKNQHFCRLPNSVFAKDTVNHAMTPRIPPITTTTIKPMKSSIAHSTYEVLNETTLQTADGTTVRLQPDLIDILDQVVEFSTSRLSFNVDANLLQLLSQESRSLRDLRKKVENDARGGSISSKPTAFNSQGIKRDATGSKLQVSAIGYSKSISLKIVCDSRVLNRVMSDEVRIRLLSKPSISSVGSRVDAQPSRSPFNTNGKNSGSTYDCRMTVLLTVLLNLLPVSLVTVPFILRILY